MKDVCDVNVQVRIHHTKAAQLSELALSFHIFLLFRTCKVEQLGNAQSWNRAPGELLLRAGSKR